MKREQDRARHRHSAAPRTWEQVAAEWNRRHPHDQTTAQSVKATGLNAIKKLRKQITEITGEHDD